MFSRLNNFSLPLNFQVLPIITNSLPISSINIHEWNIPVHIISQLADPSFHDVGSIDMLLEAEVFFDLLNGNTWNPGHDLPIFRGSKLGWIDELEILRSPSHHLS